MTEIKPYPWDEEKDKRIRNIKRVLSDADVLLTGFSTSCFLVEDFEKVREIESVQGRIRRILFDYDLEGGTIE